ncbi:MAG: hypothetical protein KA715_09195 [Xanthomonadaceae bacterium]|nr:hypothetical protein [Xanthomonadaceae bacterium]
MFATFLLLVNLSNPHAVAQSTSYSSCYAHTACYNVYGQYIGKISCAVYGSSYVYGSGDTSSACSWYVNPYRSVECTGYTKVRDSNGNYYWAWQSFNYYCP